MKSRLLFTFWLFFCVCWIRPAFAQNSLDIALEGPWIYYVDSTFQNDAGTSVPVLIAMAPWVSHHYLPSFSAGQGFPFHAGVWCVGFDTECAPITNNSTLTNGPHPALQLAPVSSQAAWKWYKSIDKKAWYLILPMPDSASNDSLTKMRLDRRFGTYFHGEKEHSIGLILHYAKGPNKVRLYSCLSPSGHNCQDRREKGAERNSGTLRITVKFEEDPADRCDLHVRDAYNKMILFLDPMSLESVTPPYNVNQATAYADLPQPDGSYDANCYVCDPQNPVQICFQTDMSAPASVDTNKALDKIVEDVGNPDLAQYHDQLHQSQLSAETLLLNDRLPRFSQLPQLEHVLTTAIDDTHNLLLQLLSKNAKNSTKPDASSSPLVRTLRDIEREEQLLRLYVSYARSGTSGKDCRAAQMQIQ